MIDLTNRKVRYITTPEGIAEIDHFVSDNDGAIEGVLVWLGEWHKKDAKFLRPHRYYRIEECEEVRK